jgi:bifunctional DNase/RNase
MIEVTVDSVRASMVSQHRVVVLKEVGDERYLPIWIGPYEADAIAIGLQEVEISRPMTHDLLKAVVDEIGAIISHILVNDLRDDTFYARIIMDVNGRHAEVDSRPSDAIALAVRAKVPILVAESVMDQAAIVPTPEEGEELSPEDEEKLTLFRDFIDSLDLGDAGGDEDEDEE